MDWVVSYNNGYSVWSGGVLSIACGVEGCEGGGVNLGSGRVLWNVRGVVGWEGGGVPFGSADGDEVLSSSVCDPEGGVGGDDMEADINAAVEAEDDCVVEWEALCAFEELELLPPDLPLVKGPFLKAT